MFMFMFTTFSAYAEDHRIDYNEADKKIIAKDYISTLSIDIKYIDKIFCDQKEAAMQINIKDDLFKFKYIIFYADVNEMEADCENLKTDLKKIKK